MIVVLHLIALAMVGAGLAAVSFGSGIVSLERGWTMVISGSVVTCAGVVVLSIAAALVRLKAITEELARIREGLTQRDMPVAQPLIGRHGPAEPAMVAPPVRFGDEAPSPAPDAEPRRWPRHAPPPLEPVAAPNQLPPETELQRPLEAEKESRGSAVPVMTPVDSDGAVAEPDSSSPTAARAPSTVSLAAPGPMTSPSADVEEPGASLPEAGAVLDEAPAISATSTSSFDGITGSSALQSAPAPNALDAAEAVVGSYSSGDNSYVMYADGSIQAQTPTGRYRFGSLDDLKRFLSSEPETEKVSMAKA